jgi:two-component system chemotaxis response regulator CheY
MKKVLIVDDSPTVRQQVVAALTPAGFEVLDAQDGAEGIAQLRAHPDLALIFCDVNMPGMSGLEMLDVAGKDVPANVPPIIMLTSEGRADLIARAKQSGAKGWLIKPVKPEQLVAVARKITGG